MPRIEQRALRDSYKQTPRKSGVYAIGCRKLDAVWIGTSQDLEKAQNRHWFTLRTGTHHIPALQAAWNKEGGTGFDYEVLDTLADDLAPLARENALKEKLAAWREKLGASLL
ncbi:GIY-YIG nuclease family protein [Pseudohoeflea suaedae]|uniref:GIY-YIG nuclease family protein n=1 Tax=Pseudohoeflea suaedae TaxID=877384 RepID=A0A4R5PKJ2_9HYPH|nr:GIY-YIG nuclease family protein [Pseudohoeflea suaedae]TDH36230.1 GIY-YIG nuclease family protein [Pseudohoeflea suaedae]